MSAATLELESPAKANGHAKTKSTAGAANGHNRKEVTKSPSKMPADTSRASPAALNSTDRPEQIWSDPIVRLPLKSLVRHPDNREPAESDVEERAASIKIHGILEPIIARAVMATRGSGLVYQVLSGETRWLACKLLKAEDIPARVIECDEAHALKLLAECNAQRKDLSPIEKARLIQRLTQPREEGGGGLTLEQAGRIYGFESGGAASNLVRLLQLPEAWQKRVASGELAWTWAREIVPFVKAKPVLAELEKDWKERNKPYAETFNTRADLMRTLTSIAKEELREISSAHFKLTDDLRTELEVIEVPLTDWNGKAEQTLVALNVKRFDELGEQAQAKKTRAKAEKDGRDEPPAKRELSREELQQKTRERGRQLADRIAAWRDKLLRQECIRAIKDGRDNGLRLILSYVPQSYRGPKVWELIEKATGRKEQHDQYCGYLWAAVGGLSDRSRMDDLLRQVAQRLLSEVEPDDWRRPVMAPALVDAYAADLGVDVAGAWIWLQATEVPDTEARYAMLEEFFLFHQTAKLHELAAELGVHLLPTVKTRAHIVKMLLGVPRGTSRRLPLPKSIKPLAIAGGKKAARKGAKARRGK